MRHRRYIQPARGYRTSIFDEVDRELRRGRSRRFHRSNSLFIGLCMAGVIVAFIFAMFYGASALSYWFGHYGPTGEYNVGLNNPLDRVDVWQTEPHSGDRVWN